MRPPTRSRASMQSTWSPACASLAAAASPAAPAPATAKSHSRILENSCLRVLAHAVCFEAAAVHHDVNARFERLYESERAAQIEQSVGAAEGVGHHRTGEHNGLVA